MTSTKSLEPFKYHSFESACYRTEEFDIFDKKYCSFVRRMCKNNGWEIARCTRGHFETSFVLRNDNDTHVNILGNDVRSFNWCKRFCVRLCDGPKDYYGKTNTWCTLETLEETIQGLFRSGN